MSKCPITYLAADTVKYSTQVLRLLSKNLTELSDFPYTSKEQIILAQERAAKLSIQGIQPKLSARLVVEKHIFQVVDSFGTYIIKPPHHIFDELPQNEDLTMKLASLSKIEVPVHGMVFNKDGSLSYFIKRFDRALKKQKIPVEDFSQLLGFTRDTKYDASMEKVVFLLDQFCTFPFVEKKKMFARLVFNFLVGNEDMHLKNYSLITLDEVHLLSPAYDLINTSIVMKTTEEIALPVNGKKSNLKRSDFVEYLAMQRMGLAAQDVRDVLEQFREDIPLWYELINRSFLSSEKKDQYSQLVNKRRLRFFS